MDCDPLFAESDDEVEVLPAVTEQYSLAPNDSTPKNAISSDYVNSTSPSQSYVVNLGSAHTPVPEEYQPLPDSSSSFDFVLGNNMDSNHTNGQRFSDINIRYQPKQLPHLQDYYYPRYGHYGQNTETRESTDYMVAPYPNNRVVHNEGRGYSNQPINYTVHSTPSQLQDSTLRRYENLQSNSNNVYNNIQSAQSSYDGNLQNHLERPSRKLNISPRRRQSKENEVNLNLIEVSSEEEDNVIGPRKRQCDNGAGRSNPTQMEASTSDSGSSSNVTSRVDIKREPSENADNSTQAGGDAANRSQNETLTNRLGSDHCPVHMPDMAQHNGHCVQNAPPVVPTVQDGPAHPTILHHIISNGHGHNLRSCGYDCSWHNPGHYVVPNRSHHHHHHHRHHHHHHRVFQCSCNTPSSVNVNNSHIKEEPVNQPTTVKVEAVTTEVSRDSETNNQPTVSAVKMEVVDQHPVKVEPGTSNQQTDTLNNANVVVKMEPNTSVDRSARCCNIDAGGDSKAKSTSPQPGPSTARSLKVESGANSSKDRVRVTILLIR